MISFHAESISTATKPFDPPADHPSGGVHVGAGYLIHSGDAPHTFPSGERHVFNRARPDFEVPTYVDIRGTDANEFVQAAMWADMQHDKGHKVTAVIPFLVGARQDHEEEFHARAYAKLVNAIGADKVVAFDTHSHVIEGLIENLTVVTSGRLIRKAVIGKDPMNSPYTGIIAPDAGAKERTKLIAQMAHLPVHQALKHRDPRTGKLDGFSCDALDPNGKYLVVDDICDGGGTFMGLADATGLGPDQLDLFVSHGVFSGRAAQLRERYGHIFTTDSLPTASNPEVGAKVIPVFPYLQTDIPQHQNVPASTLEGARA